jgi:hypothetical protein
MMSGKHTFLVSDLADNTIIPTLKQIMGLGEKKISEIGLPRHVRWLPVSFILHRY